MKDIRGYCERCESFSPFLARKKDMWLCTLCRDRMNELDRIIS